MKYPRIRLAVAPIIPVVGAVIRHYCPDWIPDGIWIISGLIACAAFLFSFMPWEEI